MSGQPIPSQERCRGRKRLLVIGLIAGGLALVLGLGSRLLPLNRHPPAPTARSPSFSVPRQLVTGGRLTLWWDVLPASVQERTVRSGEESNVRPADYIGPDSCKECHRRNYDSWSGHPHRWMNALANDATVKGDFSGRAVISYQGGQATFFREADKYLMRLERGSIKRTYEVHQTIGSRFFQYYVGKQVEGPGPAGGTFASEDHVLQFGYWLDQQEWVPVVHIGPEVNDEQRADAFAPPDQGIYYANYAVSCNYCHTTFPLADLIARRPQQIGAHAPAELHWSLRDYLEQSHPDVLPALATLKERGGENPMVRWEAPKYAVTLGVSCEACHLGAKAHVESGGQKPPKFFPSSPDLFVEKDRPLNFGRTHDNVNWACGRCHTGGRPQFAAGMSTWNSVEYADAALGSCYAQLRCIDCHNPHQAIGPKWTRTADQDDAVCLKCHAKFEPAQQRVEHTHHPLGSEGSRCLNCHMPRINEGLQDLVRTHMIFSPTRADMLEANHPNACNMCHVDRSIDWTLGNLKQWYGAKWDEHNIVAHYDDRREPVARGWLKSDNPSVRLVAIDSLARTRDPKVLPQLLAALDDPQLINRQFASKDVQELLNVRLADYGYHFYMTSEERRKPLEEIRAALLHTGAH
jgi:predicted CXXCH cytochrome family protein